MGGDPLTNRVVKVTLAAQVAEYKKGMLEAAQATRDVGSQGEKLAQTRAAMDTLGRSGVVAGGLLAAGIGVAVAKFAEFDQQMSYVQAATNESTANMDLLREAALEAGASTVFSATEAAGAVEELAKAGVSTADILSGGLKGALDLAAAGGLGVADAAAIASTTMQQFRLRGEDASHVADLLAAGAAKAMGDVSDMAQALNQSGLVASQFGISVEETTGTLAAFAQAGLLGSDAGTSFRTMLLRLANPTEEVKTLMSDLNIQAYDQQGNFVGLANLAGNLQSSLQGMTQAQRDQTLAMVFGQDAIRAANILLREGKSGIEDWTAAVDDQGFAAQTASTRLDNLLGDWEALTGALDTLFIQMGEGANGPLRTLVQGLTDLTEGFTQLPEGVQQATVLIGGAVAAVALVGGTALLAVPKIVEFRTAMQTLGVTTATTKGALSSAAGFLGGPWGIAITAAVAAATVWITTNQRMADAASEFRDTLDDSTGAVTNYTRELIAKKLQEADAFDAVKDAGVTQKELTDAIYDGGSAYDEMLKKLRDAHDASGGFNSTLGNGINTVRELGVQIADAKSGFENIEAATDDSTASTKSAAQAYQDAAAEVNSLDDELKSLIETINKANGIGQDAVSANIAYGDALAGVEDYIRQAREGAEGYSLTLDQSTQAGRDNLGMLNDLAERSQAAADAQFALDGNTDQYRATLEAGRQTLIDRAQDLGYNAEQAGALADQIFRIPSETEWKVITETATAQQGLDRFISLNSGRTIPLRVSATGIESITLPNGMVASSNADGGMYSHAFASGGGVDTGIYAGRPGSLYKFAEPETVWEAFISGKPDQRDRNIGIWQDAGRRLGVTGGDGGGRNITIKQDIKALPGMDERAIGDRAAERANFALR